MSDQTDETGPWPRAGEIWVPAMPWPTHECPVNLYVYNFRTQLAGGVDGWTWGIVEHPEMTFEIGRPPKPLSYERAVMEAWELCYGAATMKAAEVRVGPGALLIEAVGALWVYARNEEGRTVRIPARDLRLGFARVDTVEIVQHGYGEGESPLRVTRVPVNGVAAALAPMLDLDARPDQEDVLEAVSELLSTGILKFEGDPPITIRRCL